MDETLESLGSFKVSASVSEAATSRLGLVSDKTLNVSVSSWRLGLGSNGLVHILAISVIVALGQKSRQLFTLNS